MEMKYPLSCKCINDDSRNGYVVYVNGLPFLYVNFSVQLWNNVRTAFGDQTDVVELADKLSQNFESLYEEKVCKSVFLYL